ncbi:substrate-binding domain-containing protein [Streptomyces silaceus]|uniref:substrate-binding domain-containing protein n=1 Tax=Streptomyces silaceus TaxID=545123 RepID=UPI0006EBAA56|nr:substrate-binding domain-containing protein [Streptomyces silaceus]
MHTGAFSPAFGHQRLAHLLASGPEFSAVFAANDMVAIGALRALEEAGLRVPDDVSLVGYDDVPAAATLRPRLTTVRVPLEEMGREAVRIAVPDTESDAWRPTAGGGVRLGTHIVVRDSVTRRASGPAPACSGDSGR